MRSFLLTALSLTLAGCAVTPHPAIQPPMPGYRCAINDRGDFGVIKADIEVDITGKFRSGYIGWDAGNGEFANPWITAAFFRGADGHFRLDRGSIDIMRHIWRNRPGKPPSVLELSLELSTAPDAAEMYSTAHLASPYERSGGPFHITARWNDIAALASGGQHLYLIARDRKRKAVDQIELDRTSFGRATPHLEAAFIRAETMMADPATHCTHVDDLIERDIIVT